MTKKEYLSKLNELLDKNQIPNKEEILEKYQKRFSIGEELGMSEQEIIEKLKSPEDVVNSYKNQGKIIVTEEKLASETDKVFISHFIPTSLKFNLIADNLTFIIDDTQKGIKIDFNDVRKEDYSIKISDKSIKVSFNPEISFIKHFRSGNLKIYLPKEKIEEIKINTTSSNIQFDYLNTNDFIVQGCSSNLKGDYLNTNTLKIKLISGSIDFNTIQANNLYFECVSSKGKINSANLNSLNFSSVSGSLEVNSGNVNTYKISSLSGALYLNGVRIRNN